MVVSLSDARGKLPMDKLLEMKLDGVSFDHLASVYEKYTGKIAVENLRPSWLISRPDSGRASSCGSRSARSTWWPPRWSGWCLAPRSWLLVAAAVRLTSPGPVLYRRSASACAAISSRVIKFRSMRQDAEKDTGAVWATRATGA